MTIAIVGKYTHLPDSYKSLAEAMTHGGIANNVGVDLDWIDSEVFETEIEAVHKLDGVHGILVPGGFGVRGTRGHDRSRALRARTPSAVFRHLLWHADGDHRGGARPRRSARRRLDRIRPVPHPVVGLMTEWMRGNTVERRNSTDDLGGTMRLGAYPAVLAPESRVAEIYRRRTDQRTSSPPLRGQYRLQADARSGRACGFPACRPTACCRRSSRFPDHPWYIGVQFHPELKSKPFEPHPLFTSFIRAALDQSRLV